MIKSIKWLLNLFRNKDLSVSEKWLVEHDIKEASEGWTGPRWRFPAEIAEQKRLERKLRMSIVRSKISEEKERRAQ